MTREEAIDVLKHNYPSACFEDLCDAVEVAIQALSADAVPVVRCKDCKYAEKIENEDIYCHSYGGVLTNNPEWYCASGERKDDE